MFNVFPEAAAGLAEVLAHGVRVPKDMEEGVAGPQRGRTLRAHRGPTIDLLVTRRVTSVYNNPTVRKDMEEGVPSPEGGRTLRAHRGPTIRSISY